MNLQENELQYILTDILIQLGHIGKILRDDELDEQDRIIMYDMLREIGSSFRSNEDWQTVLAKRNYIISGISTKQDRQFSPTIYSVPTIMFQSSLTSDSDDGELPF